MKVAIPLFGTRVSPRFGFAAEVLLAEVDGAKVTGRQRVSTAGMNPQQMVDVLQAEGVKTVICSGVTCFCQNVIAGHGMRVIPGVIGDAEEVLTAFVAGELQPGAVPVGKGIKGCRSRGRRRGWRWFG